LAIAARIHSIVPVVGPIDELFGAFRPNPDEPGADATVRGLHSDSAHYAAPVLPVIKAAGYIRTDELSTCLTDDGSATGEPLAIGELLWSLVVTRGVDVLRPVRECVAFRAGSLLFAGVSLRWLFRLRRRAALAWFRLARFFFSFAAGCRGW